MECTRTHGDVKRKWIENEDDFDNNEEKKSKIETEVNPAQRLEKMEMLMDYCRGRLERLEDSSKEIKTNQENTTTNLQELKYRNHHKFLETELINLKNFIIKERMVNKNVKKVKEIIKNIGEDYEKNMKDIQNFDSRANIIIKIFKKIYKTAEVTPNIKFTEVVTSEINQLVDICEKEQKVSKI